MPSRNVVVQPYEVPGGSATTEVAVSWELVDANGAPQLGYDEILGDGVAGAYATVVRDTAVTVALPLTTGLVPALYWRFKAQWGSLTGYRSYTSELISLDAGADMTLSDFLALDGSSPPPFSFEGLLRIAVVDALPTPQVTGTLYFVKP
jgi:hypothetical protein